MPRKGQAGFDLPPSTPGGRSKHYGGDACASPFEVERVDGSIVTVTCQNKKDSLSCSISHMNTTLIRLDEGRYFYQRWAWSDGVKGTRDAIRLRKVQS